MDPNLIKIRDSHMNLIRKGKLGTPIQQAKDYLSYIHGYDEKQVDTELDEFVVDLKQLAKQWRTRNGQETKQENL